MDNENVVCIHDGSLLNCYKNKVVEIFERKMKLEIITFIEMTQSERQRFNILSHMHTLTFNAACRQVKCDSGFAMKLDRRP